ncbi:uncharacterized protein TOT_010000052 [Theileria orientalis strain Shintoku]|uniref:Golgi apparatus membrane protein TVP23 homolog n=1 Tax=Theileria orientalis strain Shintoku TaxID=869250 RepID=J7MEI3_THEOR|nr:uncharacterized protein TOT_010000052 [Theileria orientalis strain Shintoku]PVC50321.1 hypothetical protein MACL_00002344 [Theileria orientalis]BAM38584.1 uncharacterized protein TOT_010000052 [Theileria orientalis strain Shintoku]|eukprot:XP_009688885.1 uncharacterized protein TOT_010000052 [Theileria orientalis strain Shintoku]
MDTIPVGKLNENITRADTSEFYSSVVSKLQLLTHPLSCVLHVIFKSIIVATYYGFPSIMGIFTGVSPDLIMTFCITLTLALVDLLVVKNYTSVNLVGVSWYFDICDNGSYHLLKRRIKEEVFLNNTQVKYFWFITYTWTAFWLINTLFRLTFFKLGPFIALQLVLSILLCAGGAVNLFNCTLCLEDKRALLEDKFDKFAKRINLRK